MVTFNTLGSHQRAPSPPPSPGQAVEGSPAQLPLLTPRHSAFHDVGAESQERGGVAVQTVEAGRRSRRFPLPSFPGVTAASVRLGAGRLGCPLTASDRLHNCPFPVPSGKDMSVPRPTSPDGVLAGPPQGLGAGEQTPGTCYGAGRAAGTRAAPRDRAAWPRGCGPARKWGTAATPCPAELVGNEVWWGGGVWVATDGEVILGLCVVDSSTLFAIIRWWLKMNLSER